MQNRTYDLTEVDAEIAKLDARLEALRKSIIAKDGDAYFKGTDLSAYQIAALTKTQSVAEILQDYPSLNQVMVEDAEAFSKTYPKKGKPYPSRSTKRLMSDLGNTGVFDLLDAEDAD